MSGLRYDPPAGSLLSESAPDADATTKGLVQLAGDLSGTAASPTVPGLAGKAAAVHTHAQADVTGLTAALTAKADDAATTTALAAKAPLASPTFTGDPKAPTPAQGDNDTSIATTAYVQTEAGLLVPKSLVDAKGDLLVGSADNTVVRKAVGTDGQVLSADSSQAGGIAWKPTGSSEAALHDFLAWSYDYPKQPGGGGTISDNVEFCRLVVPRGITVTNIVVQVSTGGSSLTYARAGLYKVDGTRLGITADQTTAWTSTGLKTMPITVDAGQSLTLDQSVYIVALRSVGTTRTSFERLSIGGNGSIGLSGLYRAGYLSAATLPTTLTQSGGTTLLWWAALS